MILTCPRCSSQFAVPRELIGPQGRKVQCSSCQFVWKANAGLSSAAQALDEQQGGQLDNTTGFALEAPAPQVAVAQDASAQAPMHQAPAPQAPMPQVPAPPPIPAPAPQAAGPQAPDPQAAGPQATVPGAPPPPAPEQPGGEPPPPNAAPPNQPPAQAPDQPPAEGEKEELEETIPDFLSSFADGSPQDANPQQAGNQPPGNAPPGSQNDGAPPFLGNLDGGQAGMPGGPTDDGSIPDIDSVDEDIFSQPEHRPVKTVKKGPIAAWVVLLMLISGTLGVMFIERESLIASYPGLNGLYNLIGLGDSSLAYGISFGPTETSIQIQAGQPRTLFIEGTLSNTREDIAPAPFIKGTLYNSRRENLKTWFFRPEKTSILPGEEISYNTSLVDPPRGVTEINVTLASEEEAAEFEAEGAEEQEQPSDGA